MKTLTDRLYVRVAEVGNVCLGLDTDISYLPIDMQRRHSRPSDAVLTFNKAIIDATLDVTAVYKVQIAYYEALGLPGLDAYAKTLAYLRKKGAIVIADVKRGDIAKTAEMYAKAHFTGDFEADFITVNPYMGMDTLAPFYPYLEENDKGIFALAATSNPGACEIGGIKSADGESVCEKIAGMLAKENAAFPGENGYGRIGAVVGCTDKNGLAKMRALMPDIFFLIPGYGAQGGTAEDIRGCLKDGNGGVVNSSRGILLAWQKPENSGLSFDEAARAEVLRMREDIRSAV
ncbi:MAG: orotidine-5'-phosphate decarboxylase [Oscillospiraceae bacterium]|nr:orotidine-5'-phosphate decarboxylase [Oscillospiraceae bacterium]